ncbi:nitrate reductase molybdenum cofactor assembly chaperone [Lutimaribacter sp. EGI FJ00015]|uniref:Nitrate reductase molybdenum cofactor assembly chaperone n=1 Tax=Lutimaribacter degradans TaxID=2945989 RepID=A0ACC5ZTV0_9RHOB|nr:nitrate reductase molybdenum cofactor assembly chaperone [Lutimaribacter sp. EGI FJ00013]MCM2561260.1 nitrate reductase molybdenum cofactor assembly chaperone [Lutimaribacter sp. EGI FJ00013]MCO0611791.1 nitrate reductase molybdenum cofactor assembly chaperone [Lutimaribacter sp. EGI FJ00015]MCO0635088.1 nitrate reductase molybdenum cofactor assembly chaperone [Lutimaribacter sp. EGI FJ00014]
MDRTLKALSLMLSYPSQELQEAMPEIGAVLARDTRIDHATRAALQTLADELAQGDIYDLQEGYVMLFDRSRTLSLNLFEHVHGESRDRGGAMVSLIETYREGGFEPATTELPDHLPVLLEFLSTRPHDEAQEILSDAAHIMDALGTRLTRRESGYARVFKALSQLAGMQADGEALAEMLAQPDDDPTDLEALDAVWEETEVTFGPDPNAGCPQVRDMLAGMDIPKHLNRSA